MSAGAVVVGQPVGQPGGVALLLVMGLHASPLLRRVVLTQAPAQRHAAQGHVPAQRLAEVGLEDQVYDGVVEGGGFGEDCRHSESNGRHLVGVAERRPHGHDGVRAPRREEADANRHRQLERQSSVQHGLARVRPRRWSPSRLVSRGGFHEQRYFLLPGIWVTQGHKVLPPTGCSSERLEVTAMETLAWYSKVGDFEEEETTTSSGFILDCSTHPLTLPLACQ